MRLNAPGSPHLTYCTNVHAGETWPEVRAALVGHVAKVKRAVVPDRPFGLGLRLSDAAARALEAPRALQALRALLDAHGLYVFTLNGFPYGRFHGAPVRERVYRPDWREPERRAYTDRLARLLAALLPDEPGLEGSISTVPGATLDRVPSPAAAAELADALVAQVAALDRLRAQTGRTITLALEPEPLCLLETTSDVIALFERHLLPAAARAGLPEGVLRRHLGVCVDACHLAVAWESPAEALRALAAADLRVLKVQLSCGLDTDTRAAPALARFVDGVYLHQVIERGAGGEKRRFCDLPDALATVRSDEAPRPVRVHAHVPIDAERWAGLRTTRPVLEALIAALRAQPCAHLEVETYTWERLPDARPGDLDAAIARELGWARAALEERRG